MAQRMALSIVTACVALLLLPGAHGEGMQCDMVRKLWTCTAEPADPPETGPYVRH